jgi:predicted SnoaL-like aldol condensation-catalyzing enzyme
MKAQGSADLGQISRSLEEANKLLVLDAFDTLFNQRDLSAALRFWSPAYIQHSAHVPAGRAALFNFVKTLPLSARYENQAILAEGNLLMLHGRFSNIGLAANWVVVDIVRIENGQLTEHWDVIEDEATSRSSASGLPMFGTTFPDAPVRPPGLCRV